MLRIRMHGRGGQGVKTASQILGTAGFLSGYEAQDFPLYGAERRGAPIVAYARISAQPIHERGPVARPDLILIGDETLLDDPQANPLGGAERDTVIFINSIRLSESLQEHYHLPSEPVAADLTALGQQHLGRGNILSSSLSAVAARLTGLIDLPDLLEAMQLELREIGLSGKALDKNLALARDVYGQITSSRELLLNGMRPAPLAPSTPIVALRQESVSAAAPLILAPANMALRKTGNWRVDRPEIHLDQCNKCGICFARCPEGGIVLAADGYPKIDYDHCKGCLICAEECPARTIKITREELPWA